MDRLRAIKSFVAVVDAHSYTAAARQLHLSRSHLSKQINALEVTLGIRLLNRSTRHVLPTELGIEYYQSCRRLLAEFEEVEFNLRLSHHAPRGKCRILVPKSLAVLELADALCCLAKKNPELEVSVVLEDAFLDLVEHGFDLALRFGKQTNSSVISKKIGSFDFVCCATPTYLKKHGSPQIPTDLKNHQCFRHMVTTSDSRWRFRREKKETVVDVSGPIAANSTVFLRECVLRGDGIGLLPSYSVRKDLARGLLKPILTGYKTPELPLFIVYPARQHLATKVRLCIDFLANWIRRLSG